MKSQPLLLVGGLGLTSALGFGLSFALDANPVVETGVVFVAGLLLGGALTKLNPLLQRWRN